MLFHFILFYFIQIYFVSFYFNLFYFIKCFNFTLFYSSLIHHKVQPGHIVSYESIMFFNLQYLIFIFFIIREAKLHQNIQAQENKRKEKGKKTQQQPSAWSIPNYQKALQRSHQSEWKERGTAAAHNKCCEYVTHINQKYSEHRPAFDFIVQLQFSLCVSSVLHQTE